MASIHLLDESIAQKIAAGEVVERPASVVKELVENSIDAGSTFITVEIREGGVQHIRVTDNGGGIASAEVELAFLRHATSKIQTLQDLYNISQMGFRGEALYSIAAVSRLELTTKPAVQPVGVRLTIHGGKQVSLNEHGCPDGTTIIAGDLFFNTPARLKFLNKPAVEAAYVGSIVTRHILANPGISIKFVNNDRVLTHSAGDGSLKNAIYAVYGRETANGLLPVEQSTGSILVTGYLFAPADAAGNRSRQMLFVNGRPVNNPMVSSVVERVYAGLADGKKFPGYVLNLKLPSADVDVNVHPNKLQVRFSNEHEVRRVVEAAVSVAVERMRGQPILWSFPSPSPEPKEEGGGEDGKEEAAVRQPAIAHSPTPQSKPVETVAESVDRLKQDIRAVMGAAGFPMPGLQPIQTTLMQRPSIPNVATGIQADATAAPVYEQAAMEQKPAVRVIGQVFDTYALLEFEDRLLIVDQHAAHERLLYERYRQRLGQAEQCSQKLLIPQVIELSHEGKAVLDDNLSLLEAVGFELEEYGNLSFQVRAVPFILGQPQVKDFLLELLDILSEDRSLRTEELKKERVMSMACKKAVKGGDRLTGAELNALVGIIAAEDIPLTCPHGRPFVIILDRKSMEKQFKRTK